MTDTDRLNWIEQLAEQGCCPALINDDNGHWAVSFSNIQNVPKGPEPEDVDTTFFVDAKEWKNSIREAIDFAIINNQ
jgi:hypothetical protein